MKRNKSFFRLFFSVLLVMLSLSVADASQAERRLTILFTHDLHSYFLPQRHEMPDGSFVSVGGYARLATLINEERKRLGESPVLLLDAGDFSMGTLFHTAFMTEAFELTLMGAMGYDVTTIGNHEYDFKPAGLAKALAAAQKNGTNRPAIVASNVVFTADDPRDQALKEEFRKYPVREYMVIEKNGLRLGIFGILGKKAVVDAPFAKPVTFSDPVEQSRKMVKILKDDERVDLVICLSHTGTSPIKKYSEDEMIAEEVPGIDIIISGHTHTLLPEPIVIGNTLIVSAGNYAAYLGILEMALQEGNKPRMVSYGVRNITADIPEDDAVAAAILRYKEQINKSFLAPLGLHFDQVVGTIDFSTETLSYASKHPGEMGLGNLITDSYRFAIQQAEDSQYEHVSATIQPLGHIRDSIRQGPVTVADVFRVLSLGIGPDGMAGYPLITGYLTGAELKKLMEVETTVSAMKKDAHLQVSGLRCTYNPNRLPFDRVTSIAVQDRSGSYVPVNRHDLYRISANLYTAYMVDYISTVSHGILSIELKNRFGVPLKKMTDGIVFDRSNDGTNQEIKEWLSLVSYITSFPAGTGTGIPAIPGRYATPEGRILVEPSWNPVDLVRGGTIITGTVLAVLFLVAAALILLARMILRRRRRPAKLR